ncbi:MAG: hypothetical protein E6Q88_07655 [Lysobacteraceae bacterium]|nr:MAG: hypothetical protein E6Q88_07655 [Xanthomonadaceae bacterium]
MATVDQVLAAYDAQVPQDDRPRYGRERLQATLQSSPLLQANFARAIEAGQIETLSFSQAGIAGAGGSYDPASRNLDIARASYDSEADLVFVLGHEVQHALNHQGAEYRPWMQFKQDVEKIQQIHLDADRMVPPAPAGSPRDYTLAVRDYVEGVRTEEAQAHIGGFNALMSYLKQKHHGEPPSLRQMYEALPGRMADFIEVRGSQPNAEYRLKAGLTRSEDGGLAFSPDNVDAMKRHYADNFPGSFGENGLLDYRHREMMNAWKYIHASESEITAQASKARMADAFKRGVEPEPVENAYRIGFAALGANPAVLRFPQDGVIRTVDTDAEHTRLDMRKAPRDHPSRAQIDARADPTANAVRDRERSAYLLRDQGLLQGSARERLSDFGRSLRQGFGDADTDDPVPNRAQPPLPPRQSDAWNPGLLQDARRALQRAGGADTFAELGDPASFDNVAAVLTLRAAQEGMVHIDHVLLSKDRRVAFAVQGDPQSEHALRVRVDLPEAARVPAHETLRYLRANVAESALRADERAVPFRPAAAGPDLPANGVRLEPQLMTEARAALRANQWPSSPLPDDALENAAAALALRARERGLGRIDRIEWDETRERLIGIQRRNGDAPELRVDIDYRQAQQDPAAESLERLWAAIRVAVDAQAHAAPAPVAHAPVMPPPDASANTAMPASADPNAVAQNDRGPPADKDDNARSLLKH